MPVCLCVCVSKLVWEEAIGWGLRGEQGETGAIIALSGAMHPATLCLYIKQLKWVQRPFSGTFTVMLTSNWPLSFTTLNGTTDKQRWILQNDHYGESQHTSGQWTNRLAACNIRSLDACGHLFLKRGLNEDNNVNNTRQKRQTHHAACLLLFWLFSPPPAFEGGENKREGEGERGARVGLEERKTSHTD